MEALSLIDVSLEDDVLISPGDHNCLLDPPSPIDRSVTTHHSGKTTGDLHFEETNLKEDPRTEATDLNNEFPELSLSPIRSVQFKATGDLHSEETNLQEEEFRRKVDNLTDQFPELSLSPEQKRSKKETNLRKSLAWDSAFFTCEGVLNTEELASINTTFQIASKTVLAGIPEESGRSAESDRFTLESLETELFDNARASIQKSLGGLSNEDPRVNRSKKVGLGASRFGPKEKVVRAVQNKIKLSTATGISKSGLPPKQPENSSKPAPINSKLSIGATNAESKSNSLKPPRILPKSTNIPKTLIKGPAPPINNTLKRNSTGSVLNGPSVPKVTKIPSARSVIGPPNNNNNNNNNIPSTKRSQSVSFPIPKLKSPTRVSKNKPAPGPPKTIPATPSSSSSSRGKIVKTPNMLLKQASVSPNSSIDSVDLMSSNGSPGSSLTGRSLNKDPLSGGGLSRSSSNSSICSEDNNNNSKRGFKPSGLRMPAPKMGYFDKDKPLGRNMLDKENVHLNMSESVPAVNYLEEKISSLSFSHV